MGKINNDFLWQDKKRYFGAPISFTNYSFDEERLYIKKGLLITETHETLLYRILDIKSTQNIFQRLFDVGTVVLYCADQSHRIIRLESIKDFDNVRKTISRMVEDARDEKGISGLDAFSMNAFGGDHIDDCGHIL